MAAPKETQDDSLTKTQYKNTLNEISINKS